MRTALETYETSEDFARMQRYWALIHDGHGIDGLAPEGSSEGELVALRPHLRRIVGLYRIAIDDLLAESTFRRFLAIMQDLDPILDAQAGAWIAGFNFNFSAT